MIPGIYHCAFGDMFTETIIKDNGSIIVRFFNFNPMNEIYIIP